MPDASKNLRQQAEKAGASMVHGNYKMLAKYTYPPVVKMMGGADNMEATVKKLMANDTLIPGGQNMYIRVKAKQN